MRRNRDADYLRRLRREYRTAGVLPSYTGVSELMGFASKTAAAKLIKRLEAQGYVRRLESGRIAAGPRFFEVGLPEGFIRAGRADDIAGAEQCEGWSADAWLVDDPQHSLAIRVRGDSMRGAGILDGDIAIVRRNAAPKAGDVVAAVVDGEFTLKEFRRASGHAYLVAHHPDYPPIEARHSLEVIGVVCAIARRLGTAGVDRRQVGRGATT